MTNLTIDPRVDAAAGVLAKQDGWLSLSHPNPRTQETLRARVAAILEAADTVDPLRADTGQHVDSDTESSDPDFDALMVSNVNLLAKRVGWPTASRSTSSQARPCRPPLRVGGMVPDSHFRWDENKKYPVTFPAGMIVQSFDGSVWFMGDEGRWDPASSGSSSLSGPAEILYLPKPVGTKSESGEAA